MTKDNKYLPINAFYLTWLRDTGQFNRPAALWTDKKTGEVTDINSMDSLHMLIYIMLLTRADNSNYTCYPSIDKISQDCSGIDRRVIWRKLDELQQMQFITITKNKGKPNIYYMLDFAVWLKNPCY